MFKICSLSWVEILFPSLLTRKLEATEKVPYKIVLISVSGARFPLESSALYLINIMPVVFI
jgi:hypothetical protein